MFENKLARDVVEPLANLSAGKDLHDINKVSGTMKVYVCLWEELFYWKGLKEILYLVGNNAWLRHGNTQFGLPKYHAQVRYQFYELFIVTEHLSRSS